MFSRLLGFLGYERKRPPAPPERLRLLRRWSEQLNEKAGRYRDLASRLVLTEQRLEQLDTDLRTWQRRSRAVAGTDLATDAARIVGRLEGQLQELRADHATLARDEQHLRALLTDQRAAFAEQLELCRELGDDVSSCLLYIDLTKPEAVPDLELLADDERDRDFVGRVIDASGVH